MFLAKLKTSKVKKTKLRSNEIEKFKDKEVSMKTETVRTAKTTSRWKKKIDASLTDGRLKHRTDT